MTTMTTCTEDTTKTKTNTRAMQNDYERYDFWHREMAAIKPSDRSMKKLIESSKRFDEKMSNKPSKDHRSEDIGAYATSIITNSILLS